jgi:hypothetical protein
MPDDGEAVTMEARVHAIQRRIGIALPCAVMVALGCCIAGLAQVAGGNDIGLKKSNGEKVLIPANGSGFNESAHEAALGVESLDREIKNPRKRSGNREVLQAMRQIAVDSRNDAVDSLDLAYRVAQETSGGLDSAQLDSAKRNVQFAKDLLNASPPPRLYVRTAISSTVNGATIHYWDAADYKRRVGSWSSYTRGDNLHIGRYFFRVDTGDGSGPFQELVLVLSDPTEKTLSPVR